MKAFVQEAWSLDFVRQQQHSCPTLSQIKSLLVSKASPPESVDNLEFRVFVKECPNLSEGEDGILRRSSVENPGLGHIIVPRNLTSKVLQMFQDDLGHFWYCQDFC